MKRKIPVNNRNHTAAWMRRVACGLVVCLASHSFSQAQNAFEDAVKQLNLDNVRGYLQPLANSVGANINSGLFSTADIGEMGLSLQIQLVATGTMIGDAEKTFYALPPSQFPQSPVKTATVFGDMGASVSNSSNLTYYFQNGQVRTSLFPTAVPQLTVGNVFGTQAVVRYVSIPEFHNFPKSSLIGGGLQHSVSRYLPDVPVDLAVGIYFNRFSLGDIIEEKAMSYAAHISKTFALLTAYGGVQYETATMDVNYVYTGPGATPDTKLSMQLESENKFRATAGLNLNLGVLRLNADVNVGKVTVFSGGLGFGI